MGEAFPWGTGSCFAYTRDNHNSVLGIREEAMAAGGCALAVDPVPSAGGDILLVFCSAVQGLRSQCLLLHVHLETHALSHYLRALETGRKVLEGMAVEHTGVICMDSLQKLLQQLLEVMPLDARCG